jgi:hypothetical protein
MEQTQAIPETFLGVGYIRDRAGLPLEAVRVRVPRPAPGQVLIRVAASPLNPLEYKLADLYFLGRTPPLVLGLDLAGVVVAVGHGVSGIVVGDAVAGMAELTGDGGWVATGRAGAKAAMPPHASSSPSACRHPCASVPHASQSVDSTVEAINAGLQSLKVGRGILGKVAVIVDRDLAAGK